MSLRVWSTLNVIPKVIRVVQTPVYIFSRYMDLVASKRMFKTRKSVHYGPDWRLPFSLQAKINNQNIEIVQLKINYKSYL